MESGSKPRDIVSFEVFDSVCKSFLLDMAQCVSESEFISLMPIALEGKICRGKVAYEQFTSLNECEMEDYWNSVCKELELNMKYDSLQCLIAKYSNRKNVTRRPKLTEIEECLDKHRKYKLFAKEQKLEDDLSKLEKELKNVEFDYIERRKHVNDEIKCHVNEIRSTLNEKAGVLDKLIAERKQQIDLISNSDFLNIHL